MAGRSGVDAKRLKARCDTSMWIVKPQPATSAGSVASAAAAVSAVRRMVAVEPNAVAEFHSWNEDSSAA